MVPGRGVYAVTASVDGTHFHGVANVGVRPTFGGNEETVEVHLFDTDLDLYGQSMRMWFRSHLRDEMKFAGVEELVAQIQRDCEAARRELTS
ncbi:riboflavin biosynthesis protein RibF [bacterium BMS3Bbin02]|nr:riboflavin biosynthesis protein RibF [bacterium BMS3Bbin02]